MRWCQCDTSDNGRRDRELYFLFFGLAKEGGLVRNQRHSELPDDAAQLEAALLKAALWSSFGCSFLTAYKIQILLTFNFGLPPDFR